MLKLLSLFSGIGAFEKALTNIGEPFKVVNYCEIDKHASKAYSLIHGIEERKNLIDVTKINTDLLPNDIDILTYGFPCQDISNAGKQRGFTNENGELTRSGLFFEALRIIEDTKPKIAIAENVKALTTNKFKTEFKIVLDSLSEAGYINYAKILNAKNYGIPQNRERVFIISIRKDIEHGFEFPQPYELKKRVKDLQETNVDDKYYLSESRILALFNHKKRNAEKGNGFGARFITGSDIASALVTSPDKSTGQYLIIGDNKIRKFSPIESFRLMGFDDQDINILINNGISDAQLYKMAGNSIVVDVLEEIFVELLNQYENIFPIGG